MDALLAALHTEGPLQPLPAPGSSHPFSKAQVCHGIKLALCCTACLVHMLSQQLAERSQSHVAAF
jgi:hypothetical protein